MHAHLNDLLDALRRGRLSPNEEAKLEGFLAAHPEWRKPCDQELALNQLLRQLPDAPLSSNFTAQVLRAVQHEDAIAIGSVRPGWRAAILAWVPKVAAGVAVLSVGWFGYHQHRLAERQQLARELVEISRLASGAPLELMQNFEAIQRLNQVPGDVDRELIAALK